MMVTADERPDAHHGSGRRELNATKHGILSRHAVLPWEDRAEFDALLASLVGEHGPQGPTEHHLVEEIATIMWRKQRVLMAEAASHRAGLQRCLEWDPHGIVRRATPHAAARPFMGGDLRSAVATRQEAAEAELERVTSDEAGIRAAIEILRRNSANAYEEALAVLTEEGRDGWEEALMQTRLEHDLAGTEDDCQPDAPCLLRYLQGGASFWLRTERQAIESRVEIRSQALGEALDLERLDKVARYETHLDRKLGRSLSMLLKLQELRRTVTGRAA